MKRILLSLAIISIVAAVAIGATRAYFSDSAAITGNTFTSGTLALQIDSNPSSSIQDWTHGFANPSNPFANVKPGDAGEQILDIRNNGSVDGNATIKFDVTSAWNALPDNLNFVVTYDKLNNGVFDTAVASGLLTAWNHNTYTLGALGAGHIASVKIAWSVPTTAGNDIQGKSITLDTTFGLNQSVPPEIIPVISSVLHMSSTGAGGWSCPTDHPKAVSYTLTTGGQTIASQGIFKSGTSVGIYTWPTAVGYTYSPGEEGVVVVNGPVGQDVTINLSCQAL